MSFVFLSFFFLFFSLDPLFFPFTDQIFSVPQSYVYGSPYLGAATTASAAGLVPIPATQLSHAAAIAAATNQFYEYQVSVQHKHLIRFKELNEKSPVKTILFDCIVLKCCAHRFFNFRF